MSRNPAETRKKILNSTLDLLEAGDPHRVRMSDIAKAAGVSRQAVYLHFPSRAELLIAATYLLDDRKGVEERLVALEGSVEAVMLRKELQVGKVEMELPFWKGDIVVAEQPEPEPEPEPGAGSAIGPTSKQKARRNETLTARLVLDMEISTIPDGSADREAFESNFRADVAAALRILADRIEIRDIRAGSVVVDFAVFPAK